MIARTDNEDNYVKYMGNASETLDKVKIYKHSELFEDFNLKAFYLGSKNLKSRESIIENHYQILQKWFF